MVGDTLESIINGAVHLVLRLPGSRAKIALCLLNGPAQLQPELWALQALRRPSLPSVRDARMLLSFHERLGRRTVDRGPTSGFC